MENLHPQVAALLELTQHGQHRQHSQEWFEKRSTMLTASRFPDVLGHGPRKCSQQLLITRYTGESREPPTNAFMQHGIAKEEEARKRYEKETGEIVVEFGCIGHAEVDPQNGHPELGGSPDGVTRKTGKLIEIKCPITRPIKDSIPSHYVDQVQGLMYILNLDMCDFIQYRPWTNEFQITAVPKDKNWAAENVPKLLDFWKRVTERRAELEADEEFAKRRVAQVCRFAIEEYWLLKNAKAATVEKDSSLRLYQLEMKKFRFEQQKLKRRGSRKRKLEIEVEEEPPPPCLIQSDTDED